MFKMLAEWMERGKEPGFSPEAFIQTHAIWQSVPDQPDIELLSAGEMEPLWQALANATGDPDVAPPFWAFPWVGGRGLARFIQAHPELVAGRTVLDFGSGSGLVGLVAAKAGARRVYFCDIDPVAQAACRLNAARNNVPYEAYTVGDTSKPTRGIDLILAGDVCYDFSMAYRVLAWLRLCAQSGVRVVIGDPGRAYMPQDGVMCLGTVKTPTSRALEEQAEREVRVLEMVKI